MPALRLPLLQFARTDNLVTKLSGRTQEMTLMKGHGPKICRRCLYLFNAFYAIISISSYSIIICNAGQLFLLTRRNIFSKSSLLFITPVYSPTSGHSRR